MNNFERKKMRRKINFNNQLSIINNQFPFTQYIHSWKLNSMCFNLCWITFRVKLRRKINFNNQLLIINNQFPFTQYIHFSKQHKLKFVMNNFESKKCEEKLLYSGLNQKRVNSPLDTMRDRRDQIESVHTGPLQRRHKSHCT